MILLNLTLAEFLWLPAAALRTLVPVLSATRKNDA
jgi:hypothetical protein